MKVTFKLFLFSVISSNGQTSFVDFSGLVEGDLTGSGSWAGFGTVGYEVEFYSNSDGISTLGDPSPRLGNVQGNLEPFGADLDEGLLLVPGRIDSSERANVGYDLTFSFDDGLGGDVFPSETVFYLSDIDNTSTIVSIIALLDNVEVDASDWFSQSVQTRTNGTGLPAAWDPDAQSLIGVESGELWVHQFSAPLGFQFDSLIFEVSAQNRADRIVYSLGNSLVIVPEPSSSLLFLGGAGFAALFSRRRKGV